MLRMTPGYTLFVNGDSISVGQASSNFATLSYVARFASLNALNLNNYAVSGTGAQYGTISAFQHYAGRGYQQAAIYLWACGHNDAIYGNAVTPTKVAGELLSFITHVWALTSVAASDPSIAKNGVWYTGDGSLSDKASLSLGGHIMFAAAIGASLSGSFSGNTLVVRAFSGDGRSGYRMGGFSLIVDGVAVGAFSGDGKTDGIALGSPAAAHSALMVTDLGAGAHTFAITQTDLNGPLYIDTVDTLRAHNQCEPILVLLPPRPSSYSIGGGTSSAASFDAIDAAIEGVAALFKGYPIEIVRTNCYLDPAHVGTDNEHPTDAGHLDIAHACASVVAA